MLPGPVTQYVTTWPHSESVVRQSIIVGAFEAKCSPPGSQRAKRKKSKLDREGAGTRSHLYEYTLK